MFGFDALAAFTHNLENAFDEVRSGRLAVTAELVDLALGASIISATFSKILHMTTSVARDALLTRCAP